MYTIGEGAGWWYISELPLTEHFSIRQMEITSHLESNLEGIVIEIEMKI